MTFLPLPDQHSHLPSTGGFGDLFRITGAVGPEAANARDDVIRAQILLGQTGDFDLDSLGGPTGWPGSELTRGLRRYQRRKGLTVDGLMLPDGETIRALQADLHDGLADYRAPTTIEVDGFHDRLARYRDDGDEDVDPPRLELPRADGNRLEALPRAEVRSDADVDASPGFTPGAQVAQAGEVMQMIQAQAAANAAGAGAGAAKQAGTAAARQAVPGTTPETDRAVRQLEEWAGDKINLLTLPAQIPGAIVNGTPIKLSSTLLDPALEAAGKTPSLAPSAPDDAGLKKYSGALLAEGTRAIESGIQDIFGTTVERHETENSRLSSNIIVKACNEVIERNIRLHGFDHVAGASESGEGVTEKSEASLKDGIKNKGGGGHSFPDVLYENGEWRVAINSATESAPGQYIGREVRSFAKLLTNIGQGVAKIIGKKRPDEDIREYEKRASQVCEDAFAEVLEKKDAEAEEQPVDPQLPSP